ncbi:MAG TPA: hypothetical protein HA315_05660 [Candidatus Thalassarchaeaceae archaeon]|jgi:TATA-box binding protein (TBP) (component of TFIID and TFIIIB)|nr:hypothetical protein [Euryarchaeota archaeon]DAC42311.1 MAG TPA: hypothetical protein D7H72_05650 [Candidatus Poseidoniales archaeon]HII35465.1 hypothetical protein [Candidatus Thalassarchaeaceae archaeon]|tara:strand:+ start:2523 stop:3047 length:525 start_codon:yes stop_codon:yes gene_type:complete
MSVSPNFNIETQTFRFTPSVPIDHGEAIMLTSGTKAGDYVVVSHEEPRATYVIEPNGSILVHGLSRSEVAELAVQELLLNLGLPLEGLSMDSGEIIVSFSLGKNVLLETAEKRFADIEMDARIGAIRISASLHKATIILYDNGKGVVLGQTSRKVSEMAVRHWADKLDNEEALT